MSIEEIFLIIQGVFALISIVFNLILAFKSKNYKKIQEIIDAIPSILNESEMLFDGKEKGALKKNYAKTSIKLQALSKHVKLSDSTIDDLIENSLISPQKKSVQTSEGSSNSSASVNATDSHVKDSSLVRKDILN